MKKLFFLIIATLLCFFTVSADESQFAWLDKGVWPESPQAATIRAVTAPQPSMLTGAAEFSVPLYTLQAEELSIPFEFRYHSNGILVSDDPCPWGHGWTLSPMIRLSRRIVGRPDGYFELLSDHLSERGTSFPDHSECFYSMTDSLVLFEATQEDSKLLDTGHDIFTAQLVGHQFSFIYDGGQFITASNQEYRISFNRTDYTFSITDPRGFVYNFDVAGEYTKTKLFCTEWFPSSITCPSGRKVEFSYIDCDAHVRNEQSRTAPAWRYECKPNLNPTWVVSGSNNVVSYFKPDFSGGKHLSSVEFAGEKIELIYSNVRDNNSIRDSHRIQDFKVTYNNNVIADYKFTYAFNMPSIISTPLGKYTFDYYKPTYFNESKGRDWWGYYRDDNGFGPPSVNVTNFGALADIDCKVRYFSGQERSVDADSMKVNMLVRATVPTGGTIEWEYEPHEFEPFENPSGTGISNMPTLRMGGGLRVHCIRRSDGSRADSLVYSYGPNGNGKAVCKYAPTLDTFVGVRKTKSCFYDDVTAGLLEKCDVFFFGDSRYMTGLIGEIPIWYDTVIETAIEGKTEYHFSTDIDSPEMESLTNGDIHPERHTNAFSSGPKLVKKVVYAGTPGNYRPVQTDSMTYETCLTTTVKDWHMARRFTSDVGENVPDFTAAPVFKDFGVIDIEMKDVYGFRQYDVEIQREMLKSTVSTEHFDNGDYTVTRTYTYADSTGIITSTTNRTKGQSITTLIEYPSQASTGVEREMYARNLRAVAVGEKQISRQCTFETRADMERKNNIFRPKLIKNRRNSSQWYTSRSYTWDDYGCMISSTDSTGIVTAYTWDVTGRYPLSMTVGTLKSRAEWQYCVGLSSLITPDNVRTRFSYDSAGRLIKSELEGLGTLTTWQYSIDPDGDGNYVRAVNYLSPSASDRHPFIQTNYDRLGREITQVSAYANKRGVWSYIGTGISYDHMGRMNKKFVPAPVDGSYIAEGKVGDFGKSFYNDNSPFETTLYEASQRSLESFALKAGDAWVQSGRKTTYRRHTNDTYKYLCYQVTPGATNIASGGIYAPGSLLVEEYVDEDGITETIFKDLRGNIIQKRRGEISTYYSYDDYGDLRYILPPNFNVPSDNLSNSKISSLAYVYSYDNRGRLISTSWPGRSPSYYRYDSADRLVAENDADLGNRWRLYFYDTNGREALVMETATNPDMIHHLYKACPVTFSSTGRYACYTPMVNLPADVRICYANYYDNYSFINGIETDMKPSFEADAIAGQNYKTSVSGRPTGKYVTDDSGGYSVESYYYDNFGRKRQSVRLSSVFSSRISTSYTYAGEVEKQAEKVTYNIGGISRTLTTSNTYDPGGRLTSTEVSLDGCSPQSTTYAYDEVGRVSSVSNGVSGSTAYNLRDYSYDIHGWPTKIETTIGLSRVVLNPGTSLSNDFYGRASGISLRPPITLKPLKFTETILYNQGRRPRYNGTPSQRSLTLGGTYYYRYDSIDRLIAADYEPESGSDADFSTAYNYDNLSRPTSVLRYGVVDIDGDKEVFGVLDKLSYTYDGALASSISTDLDAVEGRDFYGRMGWGGSTFMSTAPMSYNAAGRLSADHSRYIGRISYNTLGLPVGYSTGTEMYASPRLTRKYDSTGRRLRQTEVEYVMGSSVTSADRRYEGSFTFNADTLERVDFPGGYYDGAGRAHYLYTDWQGNVTMVCNQNGTIEQHTGYYPYGEPWREPAGQHAALFAGKERMQGRASGQTDFGPRMFNHATILWDALDRKSPEYANYGTQVYCAANPIRNIDPTGDDYYCFDQNGRLLCSAPDDSDVIEIIKGNGCYAETPKLPKGTIEHVNTNFVSSKYLSMKIRGDENGEYLFKFFADHSKVEFSLLQLGETGKKGLNFITSSHLKGSERAFVHLFNGQIRFGYNFRRFVHNHPSGSNNPSEPDLNTGEVLYQYNGNIVLDIYSSKTGLFVPYQQKVKERILSTESTY